MILFPLREAEAAMRVLPQSEMSAIFVVIADVVFQQSFQVPLVQNDDVIKQISSHTPNPALGETSDSPTEGGCEWVWCWPSHQWLWSISLHFCF